MLSVAGKSHSISMQAVSRPLLTPDEVMQLPGPKTVGDKVIGPGEMLVFVTNQRPIRGVQRLFFLDPVWLRRSQIPAPATSDVVRSVMAGPRFPAEAS
jgi:type IV secretion system protein VirD4